MELPLSRLSRKQLPLTHSICRSWVFTFASIASRSLASRVAPIGGLTIESRPLFVVDPPSNGHCSDGGHKQEILFIDQLVF